jgi:hypothetical protein
MQRGGDRSATTMGRHGPTPLVLLATALFLVLTVAVTRMAGIALPTLGAQEAESQPAATSADSQRLSAFVGVWQRRDAWLWVFESGEARLRWRTDWCDNTTSTVCDHIDDGRLTIGALAEMRFTGQGEARLQSVDGRVVSMNTQGPLHAGSIRLRRVADDLVKLEQDTRTIVLCRPPRDLNFCDASPDDPVGAAG